MPKIKPEMVFQRYGEHAYLLVPSYLI